MNRAVLTSLRALKQFLGGFDLARMLRDPSFILGGVPQSAAVRCMGQRGRQYAVYLHHSLLKEGATCYTTMPGDYCAGLSVDLPEGRYQVEWVDPAAGNTLSSEVLLHGGGEALLDSPLYTVDIALRILRQAD